MFLRRFIVCIGLFLFTASPVFAGMGYDTQPSPSSKTAVNNKQSKLVNLNQANEKTLRSVKGISRARARAIVKYREINGPFQTVDDLAKVKGFNKMKSKKLKAIQEQLTVK